MKTMRKFGAIVLAIMMIAMVGVAFATGEATLTNGKFGTVTNNTTTTINESLNSFSYC